MLAEEWTSVPDFPEYSISNYGRVRSIRLDRLLAWSPIYYNIPTVGMMRDGVQMRRSVPVLVCRAFIPQPAPHFDTPIHLDGDRTNCRVDNLAWRPRWFAINYHKQFSSPPFPEWDSDIVLLETGEVFSTPAEAARKYGEIEREIFRSTVSERAVFPHDHHYVIQRE